MAADFARSTFDTGSLPSVAKSGSIVAIVGLMILGLVGLEPLAPRLALADLRMSDGDFWRQVSFLSVFALALLSALTTRVRTAFIIPSGIWLLLFWCFVSVSWSAAPEIALRRFTLLFVVTLSVFLCVNVLGVHRVLKTVGFVLAAILVCDWLSILVSKNAVHLVGELDPALIGKWRGLHVHKNTAGFIMALSSLVFLFYPPTRSRVVQILLLLGSLVFLFFSGSKSSLGLLPISAAFGALFRMPLPSRQVRAIMLLLSSLIIVATVSAISIYIYNIRSPLDAGALFSGRAVIWNQVLWLTAVRPLIGYGYGSFWGTGNLSPMMSYYYSWTFYLEDAHNGYIDVAASIGIVGVFATVAFLIAAPVYRLLLYDTREQTQPLLASCIVFFVLHNLIESSLLVINGLFVIHLLVVALIYERRRRRRFTVVSLASPLSS